MTDNIVDEKNPIYILGLNGLGYFLASQLSDIGHKVIILGTPKEIKSLQKNIITIREERILQKQKYHFESAFEIKVKPKLLIITAGVGKVKSSLLLLSSAKLADVPVMNFSIHTNCMMLKELFGEMVIPCYFRGYILEENNQISLFGRQSEIILAAEKKSEIEKIFNDTKVIVNFDYENVQNSFWYNFIFITTINLLSGAYNKTIYNLIKDKEERLLIEDCVKELSELAVAEYAVLDVDDIIKEIYNIPNNYQTPLQYEFSKGKNYEFIATSRYIADKCLLHKLKLPLVTRLIKDINNKILV